MAESPLVVIGANDVATLESTKRLLQLVLDCNYSHVYFSIKETYICHRRLMKCLCNIYTMARRFTIDSKVTVLLHSQLLLMDSPVWDAILYTGTVTLCDLPKSDLKPECLDFYGTSSSFDDDRRTCFKSGYFGTSALGGTFDHLHDGHRILLTIAAFLTKSILIVGITGPELLKDKQYAEYMQSFQKRKSEVQDFLNLIKPGLQLNIQEINDICGPTAQIENINALVLSEESRKGGDYVNNVRQEKGWSPLELVVIDVIGGSDTEHFGDKLSSTDYRRMEYEQDKLDM